jgi:hypothetical protein
MKSLLLLTIALVVFTGCDSKKEECIYNGQKVSCDQMPGKKSDELKKPKAESVEVTARGRYETKNGQFMALTDIKKDQSKVVGDMKYNCSINMEKNKPVDYRVNEREFVLISEGQEIPFERLDQVDYSNLILGSFENYNSDNKMKLTLKFRNQDTLEITNICYFN